MNKADIIVQKYEKCRRQYEAFAARLKRLIQEILSLQSLPYHAVVARAKEVSSLKEKVRRPGKDYQHLEDVTDLCGIRVISYFADDVDRIQTLLRKEFEVVDELSVDKRREIPESAFGYRSVHLIGQLRDSRSILPEYGTFKDFYFEIQVRSILQHAWAEIEHDLGYKNPTGIPRPLRRRFAKLAALLELADDEFERVRDDLSIHSKRTEVSVLEEPTETEIDQVSLEKFLESDNTIASIVDKFTHKGEAPKAVTSKFWINDLPEYLSVLGIENIQELKDELVNYAEKIIAAWEVAFPEPIGDWTKDMILFAFVLIKISVENSPEVADELFDAIGVGPRDNFQQEVHLKVEKVSNS